MGISYQSKTFFLSLSLSLPRSINQIPPQTMTAPSSPYLAPMFPTTTLPPQQPCVPKLSAFIHSDENLTGLPWVIQWLRLHTSLQGTRVQSLPGGTKERKSRPTNHIYRITLASLEFPNQDTRYVSVTPKEPSQSCCSPRKAEENN